MEEMREVWAWMSGDSGVLSLWIVEKFVEWSGLRKRKEERRGGL